MHSQFPELVRKVLEGQARPAECFAVTRYLLAARQASAQGIDDEHARAAHARLLRLDESRIRECVAQDRTLERYTPGELGTLRGHWLAMTPGLAPPSLAP